MKKFLLLMSIIFSVNSYADSVDELYMDFIQTSNGIFNLYSPMGPFDKIDNNTLINAQIRTPNEKKQLGAFGTLKVYGVDEKLNKCSKECVYFIIEEVVPKEYCGKFVSLYIGQNSHMPILLNNQSIKQDNKMICSFKDKTFKLQYIHYH